jgi:hypothetical protein
MLGALVLVAALGCGARSNGGALGTGGTSDAGGSGGVGGSAGHAAMAVPSQHRAASTVCSTIEADAGPPTQGYDGGARGPVDPDGGGAIPCSSSDSCPACANGLQDRCFASGGGGNGGISFCQCDECNSDTDCGAKAACVCEGTPGQRVGVGNECVPAGCHVDADCGPGGSCSPTWYAFNGQWSVGGYYCHTPLDQCVNDDDCAPKRCSYSVQAAFWSCFTDAAAG